MASEKRGLAGYLKLFFSGFIMGSADVVPGVSGGTMAFILGIYGELIESIAKFTSFDAIKTMLCFRLKKAFATLPWQFLLVLALGIVTAIVTTASGIKWMLENRPQEIWAFFFGLVLVPRRRLALSRCGRWPRRLRLRGQSRPQLLGRPRGPSPRLRLRRPRRR